MTHLATLGLTCMGLYFNESIRLVQCQLGEAEGYQGTRAEVRWLVGATE